MEKSQEPNSDEQNYSPENGHATTELPPDQESEKQNNSPENKQDPIEKSPEKNSDNQNNSSDSGYTITELSPEQNSDKQKCSPENKHATMEQSPGPLPDKHNSSPREGKANTELSQEPQPHADEQNNSPIKEHLPKTGKSALNQPLGQHIDTENNGPEKDPTKTGKSALNQPLEPHRDQQYNSQQNGHPPTQTEKTSLNQTNVYPKTTNSGYISQQDSTVPQPQAMCRRFYVEEDYPSNICAVLLSWFVCCFCCCALGILSCCIAVKARDGTSPKEARRRLQTVYVLCLAGILIGLTMYGMAAIVRLIVDANSNPFWTKWE